MLCHHFGGAGNFTRFVKDVWLMMEDIALFYCILRIIKRFCFKYSSSAVHLPSGKIIESNSHFLLSHLRALGVTVKSIVTTGHDKDMLIQWIRFVG